MRVGVAVWWREWCCCCPWLEAMMSYETSWRLASLPARRAEWLSQTDSCLFLELTYMSLSQQKGPEIRDLLFSFSQERICQP
jgi:hypothetical protein